ncbi:MAG: type II toxin-antitoxin system VapC family toxin [Proteobacteria bacterium]|nr:type II toxin-antitoxin system VapC family toxin [Pseudomonadota bacterium]
MSTLLDTNVLSELLRAKPSPLVLKWFAAQPPESLFVSAVTQAEMMLGARLLPAGKRRTALEGALTAMFDEDFAGRVLPFDASTVPAYIEIVSGRRSLGRPISQFDAQIAAIARRTGAKLATRNTADFEHCGVALVDPWNGASD